VLIMKSSLNEGRTVTDGAAVDIEVHDRRCSMCSSFNVISAAAWRQADVAALQRCMRGVSAHSPATGYAQRYGWPAHAV